MAAGKDDTLTALEREGQGWRRSSRQQTARFGKHMQNIGRTDDLPPQGQAERDLLGRPSHGTIPGSVRGAAGGGTIIFGGIIIARRRKIPR
jgi:hypothetical protein